MFQLDKSQQDFQQATRSWVETRFPKALANELERREHEYQARHAFHYELLRPAATAWDLRVLDGLWHAAERCVRLAFSGREAEPDEHERRGHVHADILTVVRTRNMEKVAAATRQHLDDNEQIALRALDPIAP